MGAIGQRITRKEDQRFLTGKGRYTDDMNLPGQAYAYIVRSQVAHGKLNGVDTSEAENMPGVLAVLTSKDTAALGGLPCGWAVNSKDGSAMVEPKWPVLAEDKVRYVGQSIAMVVAETKEQAKAAGKTIMPDIDDLDAVGTLEAAVNGAGIEVHDGTTDNVCYDWELGEKAPVDEAFKTAKHIVELDVRNQRVVPNAMEPRAAIGQYDAAGDSYTLITTSQNPHLIRLLLGAFVMQVPEHKIRVVAPDVGGGFGSKIFHYAEEVLCVIAAKAVGCPVKWTAERTESFLTDAHGRDHISKARLALDEDGRFLALHVQTEANMGAYLSTFAPAVPTYLYATLLAGVYTTPAIYAEVKARFTNTTPVDAYRGAGRPEAAYLIERVVEEAARQTGIDRVELRRKNMIKKDQFPYQTPVALEYDTGDFEACLDMALEKIDYANFEKRREESKARGKVRGLGISTYVEACGIAPSALAGALGARAGLYESSTIRVHPTGSVTVFTGTHSHGQGHETTFAQIVADHFGIEVDQVILEHGDSAQSAFGMGTYG
ncbi:MAG: xanthine dehydrogenase family protein molybdopterin-binding subunit, partial [Myxococcota bacterium]